MIVGKIENGLERGFLKHRLNCLLITDPSCLWCFHQIFWLLLFSPFKFTWFDISFMTKSCTNNEKKLYQIKAKQHNQTITISDAGPLSVNTRRGSSDAVEISEEELSGDPVENTRKIKM